MESQKRSHERLVCVCSCCYLLTVVFLGGEVLRGIIGPTIASEADTTRKLQHRIITLEDEVQRGTTVHKQLQEEVRLLRERTDERVTRLHQLRNAR